MASTPITLVTPRDLEIFRALEHTPLTVRQLLKLSVTFSPPFTTERRVQERLQKLRAAGRVRRWVYATAGQGALSYYTLSPLGYQLLHGPDAKAMTRGAFAPVGVARQRHTRHLADAIVHLLVAAHEAKIPVMEFHRENALALRSGEQTLYPDTALSLVPPGRGLFTFFLELDNSTETVRSGTSPDAWERKVRFYEAYQDGQENRFRVLALTTGGPTRLEHLLSTAAHVAGDPRRSLVYGVTLANFLDEADALHGDVFCDHRGRSVALVPRPTRIEFGNGVRVVLPSAACLSSAQV